MALFIFLSWRALDLGARTRRLGAVRPTYLPGFSKAMIVRSDALESDVATFLGVRPTLYRHVVFATLVPLIYGCIEVENFRLACSRRHAEKITQGLDAWSALTL